MLLLFFFAREISARLPKNAPFAHARRLNCSTGTGSRGSRGPSGRKQGLSVLPLFVTSGKTFQNGGKIYCEVAELLFVFILILIKSAWISPSSRMITLM